MLAGILSKKRSDLYFNFTIFSDDETIFLSHPLYEFSYFNFQTKSRKFFVELSLETFNRKRLIEN